MKLCIDEFLSAIAGSINHGSKGAAVLYQGVHGGRGYRVGGLSGGDAVDVDSTFLFFLSGQTSSPINPKRISLDHFGGPKRIYDPCRCTFRPPRAEMLSGTQLARLRLEPHSHPCRSRLKGFVAFLSDGDWLRANTPLPKRTRLLRLLDARGNHTEDWRHGRQAFGSTVECVIQMT